MKRLLIILGCLFITSCGEVLPKIPEPSPPTPQEPKLEDREPVNPIYTESCSDDSEMASLENEEADGFEIEIACLIHLHDDQMRPSMSYHPDLGKVARVRTDDMALNGFYLDPPHVDDAGFGPNYYICLIGYAADFCPVSNPEENSVESAVAGFDTSTEALQAWLNSPEHRKHILAEHEYYTGQIYYGFGHAYASYPPYYDYGTHFYIALLAYPPMNDMDEFKAVEIIFMTHEPLIMSAE